MDVVQQANRRVRAFKAGRKVYTVVVPNTICHTLPIIREKVKPDSIVYTDFYRSYDVLDVVEFNPFFALITAHTSLKIKSH